MATTKELLEKAMLRLGSRGSRSDGVSVNFVPDQTTTGFQSFTAPQDGFCEASGVATLDTGMIWMDDRRGCRYAIRALWNGGALSFSFPVRKGDSFMCQFFQMSTRSVNFIKSVGGGLRLLAETLKCGGELWLRLRVSFKKLLEQGRKTLSGTTERQSKFKLREQVGQTRRSTVPLRMGLFRCFATSHQKHGSLPMGMTTMHGLEQATRSIVAVFAYLFARVNSLLCGVNSARMKRVMFQQRSFLSLNSLAIEGGF